MSELPKQEDTEDLEKPEDALQAALDSSDEAQVAEIVDTLSNQEALRQVSLMDSGDRDDLMTMLTPEAAAELIEEAPAELAVTMMGNLEGSWKSCIPIPRPILCRTWRRKTPKRF